MRSFFTPLEKVETSNNRSKPMPTLSTVIFLGSARNQAAMWGGDARLGDRVSNWVTGHLNSRASKVGDEDVSHEVTVFDPISVFGPGGALAHSGAQISVPTFFAKDVPEGARAMGDAIARADAIICMTAEYNHSVPPALSSMLNHFGEKRGGEASAARLRRCVLRCCCGGVDFCLWNGSE